MKHPTKLGRHEPASIGSICRVRARRNEAAIGATVLYAVIQLPSALCIADKSRCVAGGRVGRPCASRPQTWTADNGNGTYSNPLFYDEFSDPDPIRVGNDYFLTGTTMHSMPGQPVLHSTDLVNWSLGYALDRLDLGPEYRLEEGGRSVYGQGLWAPSFRYHDGTYLHLREREPAHHAAVPGAEREGRGRGAHEARLPRPVRALRRRRRGLRHLGLQDIRFAQLNQHADWRSCRAASAS